MRANIKITELNRCDSILSLCSHGYESPMMMGFASYTRRDWCNQLTDNQTIVHSNTQADRHIKRRRSIVLGQVPGGYSTLVWIGVCLWEFLSATHACTNFEEKLTHPCTKNPNFLQKFAPFWLKFRKIFKSRPIKVL